MIVALWIVAIVLMIAGLVGAVAPALPGPPLVFAGILVLAAAYRFERIGIVTLIVLGIVTVALIAVDMAASAAGTKKFGGTWRGALGAAVGGIAGLFVGPVGLIVGSLLGAVLGELAGGKDTNAAFRAGGGAVLGLLAGAVIKLVACMGMIAAGLSAHFFFT